MTHLTTSPRDWTEDFADENGCYQCECLSCGNAFLGYKRRMCCRVCADAMQKVEDERAVLIAKIGLVPAEWRLLTVAEVDNMHGLYAGQLLQLHDLKRALEDIATTAHCLAKAGPLNTPTLAAAWGQFMRLESLAVAALSKARQINQPSPT